MASASTQHFVPGKDSLKHVDLNWNSSDGTRLSFYSMFICMRIEYIPSPNVKLLYYDWLQSFLNGIQSCFPFCRGSTYHLAVGRSCASPFFSISFIIIFGFATVIQGLIGAELVVQAIRRASLWHPIEIQTGLYRSTRGLINLKMVFIARLISLLDLRTDSHDASYTEAPLL